MKLDAATLSDLGQASKIIATKDTTTIVGGKGKKKDIESRIAQVKNQLKTAESKYEKEKLQKRLAKIAGGVAVIRVGAATETELTYIKHKMEDALAATRAAYEEGVVSGGGTALFKSATNVKNKIVPSIAKKSDEYKAGFSIVVKALEEPLRQIVINCGKKDPGVVLNEISQSKLKNFGYDALEDKYVDDMLKAGIIDPLKVTRTALENALSVSGILLTTQAVVADKPEEKNAGAAMQMPAGMGGMM
jgi:chaperonin GroEL